MISVHMTHCQISKHLKGLWFNLRWFIHKIIAMGVASFTLGDNLKAKSVAVQVGQRGCQFPVLRKRWLQLLTKMIFQLGSWDLAIECHRYGESLEVATWLISVLALYHCNGTWESHLPDTPGACSRGRLSGHVAWLGHLVMLQTCGAVAPSSIDNASCNLASLFFHYICTWLYLQIGI